MVRVGWWWTLAHIAYAGASWEPARSIAVQSDGSGSQLATGDLDCDGYIDLVVGSHGYGETDQGLVEVFYGTPTGPSSVADWEWRGTPPGHLGISVAIGDFNQDGCDDLLLGEPLRPSDGDAEALVGEVVGFLGGPGRLGRSTDLKFRGTVDGDGVGKAVAILPGLMGEAGGMWAYTGPGYLDNQGFVVLGELGPDFEVRTTVLVGEVEERLGAALGAADVDGDGYADLLVGASGWEDSTGRVVVYRGTAAGVSPEARYTFSGDLRGSYTGEVVAGLGSLDETDREAFAVCMPERDANTGRLAVVALDAESDAMDVRYILDGAPSTRLCNDVVGQLDVDGDGTHDLVVSVRGLGEAWVLYGEADGSFSEVPAVTVRGGVRAVGLGDLNGDGYDDLATTTEAEDAVYIYMGRPDLDHDGVGDADDCAPEDPSVGAAPDIYPDADRDGFGTDERFADPCSPDGPSATETGDCDDSSDLVFPGATDWPGDGIDQDCDGQDATTAPLAGEWARTCGVVSGAVATLWCWVLGAGVLWRRRRWPPR